MFWEEKIDIIKKKYKDEDFKVPFTNWSEILNEIEKRFIVKESSQDYYKNWIRKIKDKKQIQIITNSLLIDYSKVLGITKNFWVVIVSGNLGDRRHLVYDCKPFVITDLIKISDTSLFIVDKKYDWLVCFEKIDDQKTIVNKSGNSKTPFD